jgi:hypothetical protein
MDLHKDWLIETNLDISEYKPIILEAIKTIESDTKDLSTSGNLSKQYNIYHKYNEEPFKQLVKKVSECVKEALVVSNVIHADNNLRLEAAWVVEGRDYGYHTLHKHNERIPHVATVIYLDIQIQEPLRNDNDNDGYFYCITTDNNEIYAKSIKPEVNKLLIFPVWVWHGTYPQKKGLRISLNLDFSIE